MSSSTGISDWPTSAAKLASVMISGSLTGRWDLHFPHTGCSPFEIFSVGILFMAPQAGQPNSSVSSMARPHLQYRLNRDTPSDDRASNTVGVFMENLKGLKVAILIDNGFEEVEMTEPRKALDQAGAETKIVSPAGDR